MYKLNATNIRTGEVYYQNDLGSCMYIYPAKNIHEAVRGSEIAKAIKKDPWLEPCNNEYATEADFNEFLTAFCKSSE